MCATLAHVERGKVLSALAALTTKGARQLWLKGGSGRDLSRPSSLHLKGDLDLRRVRQGPQAEAGGVQRSVRMRPECPGVPASSSEIQAVEGYCCRSVRTAIASGTPMNAPGIPHNSAAKKTAKTTRNGEIERALPDKRGSR